MIRTASRFRPGPQQTQELEPAMLFTVFRAVNAIFTVVVAIIITQRFGESHTAKLAAVLITSAVVVFFEWLMRWTPTRSPFVRRLLDSRAVFSGPWLQQVVRSHGTNAPKEGQNTFAVLTVSYSKHDDNYAVDGTAYTAGGDEHARWESTDVVNFAKNGRVMTYEWTGTVTNRTLAEERLKRSGFARFTLPDEDGGRGRVDHVGGDVSLEINLTRITKKWLAAQNLSDHNADRLGTPSARDELARAYAARLGRREAVVTKP
jgi:hypothetical protein